MPRDGQGGFVPPLNNWNPALDGNEADPASWNQLLADISAGLAQSVSSDGQTMLTGSLKMGGNTLQGMGAPSGNGQALRRDQLIKGPNIESASTISIPAEGSVLEVTGTTAINQMSGSYDGRMVVLVFQDKLTIKHGSNLQLPNATDITTKAGDAFVFYRKSSSEWAALFRTAAYADIVGTMAGGAIIEQGSNANGRYVRFADGTQICWLFYGLGGSGTTEPYGQLFMSAPASRDFPAGFSGTPNILYGVTQTSGVVWGAGSSLNSTSYSFRLVSPLSTNAEVRRSWIAIGRWN